MLKTLSAALSVMFFSAIPVYADSQPIVLATMKYVAPSEKVQHFSESIELQKGQEKLQLMLTYYNGTNTAPGFKWLRISSASMSYITEKQFGNGKTFSTDVTGELTWGGNQLLVTAAGPPGATFEWVLSTPRPSITSIPTEQISPGETIMISGSNLCPDPSGNEVLINGRPARCLSATSSKLTVQVPEDVKGSNATINVKVAGVDAGGGSLSVNTVPYLRSLSAAWAAPGSQVTIYGEGFSPAANGNKVFIGPFQAEIVQVSPSSITVVVPGALGDQFYGYYYPVRVMVNGIRSRNSLTLTCNDVG